MRTTAQRIAKYQARMVSSALDPVIAATNAAQLANFTAYAVDFVPNQVALRALLNGAGLQPIDIGPYEAYHGELYGLSKRFAGLTLLTAKETLAAKWSDASHLGAGALALLNTIALDIYDLGTIGTP